MSTPAVSIIVPNFNHAKYLPERMESILSQTFTDFEVIVLDDCSTDGSREVLDRWRAHPKISQTVFSDTNSGSPFLQWEKGLELAKGDLIWIAESDDACDACLLEALVEPFISHPDTVLSFCRSRLVDSDGGDMGFHKNQKKMESPFVMNGREFVRTTLTECNAVVNASAVLFRKEAARNVDRRYLDYRGIGDWIFWTFISLQGSVAYTPEAMNRFRQHPGGTTISLSKTKTAELELVSMWNLMREYRLLTLRETYFELFECYYFSMFRLEDRLDDEEIRRLKKSTPMPVKLYSHVKHLKRHLMNGER